MTSNLPEIPFSSFLAATIVAHAIYALPAISVMYIFDLMETEALFCVFAPINLSSILGIAAFSWLIAKGSNWINTKPALIVACGYPGRIYGVLFGGLLGFHFFGLEGGIIFSISFYLLARATIKPLGNFIASKVIPDI